MGVYSTNRSNLGPIDVVAAEGYHGNIGVAQMMIEACQNDQAIFEAVISNDFKEAFGVSEGTILESELLVVNEAGFGGFIDKIKELLIKLLAKVKGLFAALIAKIQNVFIRDNKAYIEKYKAAVLKKDLSKMKYKISKPTGKELKEPTFPFHGEISSMSSLTSSDAVQKYMDDTFNDGKALESSLGSTINNSPVSAAEYAKEAHEFMYGDVEEEEGLSASAISDILSNLLSGKNTIKTIEKANNAAEKAVGEYIKKIERSRSALSKYIPKEDSGSVDVDGTTASFGNKGERDTLNAKLNALYKGAMVVQEVTTKFTTATMTEAKFGLAQDRRIFAQAAAYNDKSVKESADLMGIVAEASDYEVDSCFDSYEF